MLRQSFEVCGSNLYVGTPAFAGVENVPKLMKAYLIAEKHLIIERLFGGKRTVLEVDMRQMRPIIVDYPDNNIREVILREQSFSNPVTQELDDDLIVILISNLTTRKYGTSLCVTIPDNTTQPTTYPFFIFTEEGETETVTTVDPASDDWEQLSLPTETAEEKAARIKVRNILKWKNDLALAAQKYASENRAQDWAHEHGHSYSTTPGVVLDLNENNADHMFYIQHADHISIYIPKLLGLTWRVLSAYENPRLLSFYDIGDATEDQWQVFIEYKQGDYKRHNGVSFVCLRDHQSTVANAPGEAGGTRMWQVLMLDRIPSGINLSDGTGIKELVESVVNEMNDDVHFLWHATASQHAKWKAAFDAKRIHKIDVTSRFYNLESAEPGDLVYTSPRLAPADREDALQRKRAEGYQDADWVDLYVNHFQSARRYPAVEGQ